MATDLQPIIILVQPQMGENIGAAARAMKNFGLQKMRLVSPRDGWPNPKAWAMASGADDILESASIHDSLSSAIADCHHVVVTTARVRDQHKPMVSPEEFAAAEAQRPHQSAVVFGPERAGLENDDIALGHEILRIPVNPEFASLNLAQSVLLVGYEWMRRQGEGHLTANEREAASMAEMEGMFDHLIGELDLSGFLYPPEKRPHMVRNIKALFMRAGLSGQEVRTLRGVIRALSEFRPGKLPND
jgi:RNA methyltransferase, TrmH family, group 1